MPVDVIDFLLKGLLVKTIPLVEPLRPNLAMNPDFTKRDEAGGLVMLHYKINWLRDITDYKV